MITVTKKFGVTPSTFNSYELVIQVSDQKTNDILKDIFVLDVTLPKLLDKEDGYDPGDVKKVVEALYAAIIGE